MFILVLVQSDVARCILWASRMRSRIKDYDTSRSLSVRKCVRKAQLLIMRYVKISINTINSCSLLCQLLTPHGWLHLQVADELVKELGDHERDGSGGSEVIT